PYHQVIAFLNQLPGKEGFFFQEYCADGKPANGAPPRQYFVPENAKRIDGIRRQIKAWHDERLLSEVEHAVLLHDLMLAANKVANTAGTYGHFLSRVSQSARNALEIVPSLASPDPFPEGHAVIHDDALNTAHQVAADVFYLDPPYTK